MLLVRFGRVHALDYGRGRRLRPPVEVIMPSLDVDGIVHHQSAMHLGALRKADFQISITCFKRATRRSPLWSYYGKSEKLSPH